MIVRRLLLLSICAAALLAGCGEKDEPSFDAGSDQPPGVACTEIGCDSGLFLDLAPVKKNLPAAQRIELCLDTTCRSYDLSRIDLVNLTDEGLREGQQVEVRMTIYGSGDAVLRRSAIPATVRKAQPNGPECPPTCFQVPVRLDPETQQLVAAN